jgi:ribosomal protein S18 acetylase RimI-like enzyme
MKIRPIAPGDIEAVLALWEECQLVRRASRSAARKHALEKLTLDPDLFLVGVQSNKIVGTVIADSIRGNRGFLRYVAVAPSCRRRGHAKILLARAEKLLHRRGCQNIRLHVQCANAGAINCYGRLGYADDTLIMLKRLAPAAQPARIR